MTENHTSAPPSLSVREAYRDSLKKQIDILLEALTSLNEQFDLAAQQRTVIRALAIKEGVPSVTIRELIAALRPRLHKSEVDVLEALAERLGPDAVGGMDDATLLGTTLQAVEARIRDAASREMQV